MPEKLHFVVVCGYGCNIDSPLAPYLNRVAEFLDYNTVESVVLCGGETQKKSFPGRTEARVMYDYLQQFKCARSYMLEENSYTTYENICLAAAQIRKMRPRERLDIKFKVTIFCEAQRALKVIMLARHFICDLVKDVDDIRVETCNWERADPYRELKATIKAQCVIKFPFLARRESERQRRLSKNR